MIQIVCKFSENQTCAKLKDTLEQCKTCDWNKELKWITVKKRRNIKDCKYWKQRGKTTHYCTIDKNNPIKQCYGICKLYVEPHELYDL